MISVPKDESDSNTNNTYLKILKNIVAITREVDPDSKLSNDRSEELREVSNKLHERLMNDEKQTDSLIARIHSVKRKIRQLNASIEKYRSTKDAYMKQINSESTSDSSSFSCEYQNSNLTQICKLIQPFERLLGIQIQKTHSGLLQLLFHGCCSKSATTNTDIVCCCQLRLEKANRFELVSCNPPIHDVERLVNHLNWTEDMRSFIIVLRQRFRRYFELAAAVSNKLGTG
ncbi:unnamed protein product [Trichobilharzia szidati]|nr:unnamed protein product [Trichobilharzia szidati]CAH8834340.1 unnamed protein product [Trichobilharzia szidati]